MSAAHNAYRLHGLGPCGLQWPDCLASPPKVVGRGLHAVSAASLLLKPRLIPVSFFGFTGEDEAGTQLRRSLLSLPLDLSYFRRYPGPSPQGYGEGVLSSSAEFLEQRSRAITDWPDASLTQATWVLFDVPALAGLPAAASSWLARARRRLAFTAVWIDGEALASGSGSSSYSGWDWDAIDLAIISGGTALDMPVNSAVHILDGLAFCISRGGLFGRCEATLALPPKVDVNLCIGGMMARIMQEILEEDDFPRTEVHVDRQKLQMQPLHLFQALEWAVLAAGLVSPAAESVSGQGETAPRHGQGDSPRGAWLAAAESAWKSHHPERYRIWGGRHESERR